MAYKLEVKKSVVKSVEKLKEKERIWFFRALSEIKSNPFNAGKPLNGKRAGQYSYRIGAYRIIYRIEKQLLIVFVIEFGHRQGVY